MNNSAPAIHNTNIMEDVQQLLWWEEKSFATVEPPDPVLPSGLVLWFTVWLTVCLRRGTVAHVVSVFRKEGKSTRYDRNGRGRKEKKEVHFSPKQMVVVICVCPWSRSQDHQKNVSGPLSSLFCSIGFIVFFSPSLTRPIERSCWHPPPCFLSLIPLPSLPQPLSLCTLTCSGAFSPFSTLHSSWNPLLAGRISVSHLLIFLQSLWLPASRVTLWSPLWLRINLSAAEFLFSARSFSADDCFAYLKPLWLKPLPRRSRHLGVFGGITLLPATSAQKPAIRRTSI